MLRIGFISDHRGPSLVRAALEQLQQRSVIQLETIDDYRPVESIDQATWSLINLVDVVVAVVIKGSQNLYYEIGLAHGVGKPVIVVGEEGAPEPPPALASQRIVRITSRFDTQDSVAFRLNEAINEALTRKKPFSGPRALTDHPPSYSSPYFDSSTVADFRSLFAYEGISRAIRFEQWFASMARGVPGWEVITSDRHGRSTDGFDLVIWNSREDSELMVLGNPIAVELKAIRAMNSEALSHFLSLARKSGLKAVVLATTGVNLPRTKRLLSKLRADEGIRAIAMDRDDLIQVSTPEQLLRIFKEKVREVLYNEEA